MRIKSGSDSTLLRFTRGPIIDSFCCLQKHLNALSTARLSLCTCTSTVVLCQICYVSWCWQCVVLCHLTWASWLKPHPSCMADGTETKWFCEWTVIDSVRHCLDFCAITSVPHWPTVVGNRHSGLVLWCRGMSTYTVVTLSSPSLPPIDAIWAMMIVWRTRGDYRTARAVLEAIIAFSAMHTYYEQLLQVKQICLCLTGFTSVCLDAYVFLCSLVFYCMHVVLL